MKATALLNLKDGNCLEGFRRELELKKTGRELREILGCFLAV